MKKIKLIALRLVSMVLLSAKSSDAQNTTYKLSDYKNPNYLYQSLDLNFGLSNGLSGNKYAGTNNSSARYFNFNSQAGGAYSRYINSEKTQGDLSVNLYAGVGTGNNNSKYYYDTYNSEDKSNSSGHSES